jgi:trehalose-6-phosphate synthase
MVPELVRRKLPMASIGFFLHVPFPSSELFRCLPRRFYELYDDVFGRKSVSLPLIFVLFEIERNEILSGALGANLVGFQV